MKIIPGFKGYYKKMNWYKRKRFLEANCRFCKKKCKKRKPLLVRIKDFFKRGK